MSNLRQLVKESFARKIATAVLVLIAAGAIGLIYYLSTQPKTPTLPEPPLDKLAAAHNVQLGNFAILSRLGEKPYLNILTGQFDFVLADNTPNWYFTDGGLRPSAATYNFKQMDQVINFAQAHNLPVQAHHFVWGEEKWLPNWLKNGHYSKEQLLELIHQHIMTVGSRYRGRIQGWSVVNEAFTRNLHLYGLHDWWADHIGDLSYIDNAFIWAHQADPSAKLILNDFGNEEQNSVSDAMYAYVKSAKARGVPITGIGMQMHIDGTDPPKKEAVIANMERFAALGAQIYVTEFDVNMNNVQGDSASRNQKEAEIYYDMMRACIESKVCHSFAFLGITDKETWYGYVGLKDAQPLMFDRRYQPKPAFYSLRNALSQP